MVSQVPRHWVDAKIEVVRRGRSQALGRSASAPVLKPEPRRLCSAAEKSLGGKAVLTGKSVGSRRTLPRLATFM